MKLNLIVTTSLLALLTGVVVWALQPTQKVFSWVEMSELEFLIGHVPGRAAASPDAVPFTRFEEALQSLREGVEGPVHAFAAMGSMGKRLTLASGESFPIFFESYVSEGYFEARQVRAQHGRLVTPEDGEEALVLGHRLARTIFGDPSRAAGQTVTLGSPGFPAEERVIVGVLEPSPAQDPQVDVDEGIVGNLHVQTFRQGVYSTMPLFLQVNFHRASDVKRVMPQLERWVRDYFGPAGEIVSPVEISEKRRQFVADTLPKIEARRATLRAFGMILAASALLALYAQSFWYLLRRRQLLGVEKALGATQRRLALHLVVTQLPWGVLGGLLGWLGLWSLYDVVPRVFLTPPPAAVLIVSMLTPLLALTVLAVAVALPVIRVSAMSLLRARVSGGRVRSLLLLVYSGLALAIAGGLAASQVYLQVQREMEALHAQFSQMYTMQTGATHVDDRAERAFEAPNTFTPIFSEEDARAVEALAGVSQATLTQGIPNLGVAYNNVQTRLSAVAADGAYLDFMGLNLRQGTTDGCVLEADVAQNLGIRVGEVVQLLGLRGLIPCQITGIFETPPALWRWLVQDLPEIVTPPLDGLGLQHPSFSAEQFGSSRILLKLDSPEAEQTLRAWQAARFPNLAERAEVIPYTPDVQELLASLRIQAQLFLLVAVLAGVLSVWGIVGGFLALLDAERFRIAVDRALGLSAGRLTRRWWWQTFGLSALSALLGLLVGAVFSTRLYNALALDIPNLPARAGLSLSPLLLLVLGLALLALSAGLTYLAFRWLKRQSTLQLLKEGAV